MGYRVLGFSLAHDASVCIINDGELEYWAKEERYTRQKRDKQPFIAIDKALAAAKGPIDVAVMQAPTHHPTQLGSILGDLVSAHLDPDLELDWSEWKNKFFKIILVICQA